MQEEKKSLLELQLKSKPALNHQKLIDIAIEASSPTAAIEMAKLAGFDENLAQACRFLAMIKRDYGLEDLEAWVKLGRVEQE